MKRLVLGLLAATVLAVIALPARAGGSPAPRVPRARAVLPHGVLTLTSLGAAAPSGSWQAVASMKQAVQEMGGGAYAGGKVYVPGGFIEFNTPTLYTHMQIYSAQADTWSADPDDIPASTTGWADAAVCADPAGRIHVVNGTDGAFIYATHMVFDPSAPAGAKWSYLALPHTATDGNFYSQDSGCSFVGGKMYLFGGYGRTDEGGNPAVQRITWVYDPAADTWADTHQLMITARLWHGYTSTTVRAFAAGGTNNLVTFQSLAQSETFTPAAGWKPMANLPRSLLAPGMGMVGSTLAVYGGGTGNLGSGFTLQRTTRGCVAGACATTWTDLHRDLNAARWYLGFAAGGGRLYAAGGANGNGQSIATAERTP